MKLLIRAVIRAAVLVVGAVLIAPVASAANDQQPAGEPGQKTYIFRSLEDPTVPSQPANCPFPGANLFLGATIWSMDTRAVDGRVVNEAVQQFGTAEQ